MLSCLQSPDGSFQLEDLNAATLPWQLITKSKATKPISRLCTIRSPMAEPKRCFTTCGAKTYKDFIRGKFQKPCFAIQPCRNNKSILFRRWNNGTSLSYKTECFQALLRRNQTQPSQVT